MRVKRNLDLDIKPFKNANDERPKTLHKLLPWNFSMYVVGQSKSGKTVFWLNMITRKNKYYHKQFEKIIIFSASFRTISKKLKLPDDQLIDGFDETVLQIFLDEQK
jgi:septin family protein